LRVPRPVRLLLSVVLLAGLTVLSTGTAAAGPPPSERAASAAAAVDPAAGKPGGGGTGGGPVKTPRGYDISYPQCGGAYPSNPAFAIVGVNGGRVFSTNPCLADQLRWGGDAAAEVYINTGNPGPALSSYWRNGQTTPRLCSAANNDTADCAYDYGWNAAQQSYQALEAAYAARAISANPNATAWWLDVETSNSWRTNTALNVAALQGEVADLASRGVTRIGFYSTTVQWGTITGATQAFAPMPSWGAGASSEKAAKQHCISTPGFTGGRLAMVQFIVSGFDADIRC
jgi:hypothetical protein